MSDTKQSYELDLDKAIENVGGSRFNLILLASQRAREIEFKRRLMSRRQGDIEFPNTATTQALHEIELGILESNFNKEELLNDDSI